MRNSPENNTANLGNRTRIAALLAMTLASCAPQLEAQQPESPDANAASNSEDVTKPYTFDSQAPFIIQIPSYGPSNAQGGIEPHYTTLPKKESAIFIPSAVDETKPYTINLHAPFIIEIPTYFPSNAQGGIEPHYTTLPKKESATK